MRDTLRAARFFGIVLPAAFMIFDSAERVAATAAALSPDSIALMAFFVSVLTEERRAVLITFFFAFTKILFLADLWFAIVFYLCYFMKGRKQDIKSLCGEKTNLALTFVG
jgi:hypothetical protein